MEARWGSKDEGSEAVESLNTPPLFTFVVTASAVGEGLGVGVDVAVGVATGPGATRVGVAVGTGAACVGVGMATAVGVGSAAAPQATANSTLRAARIPPKNLSCNHFILLMSHLSFRMPQDIQGRSVALIQANSS